MPSSDVDELEAADVVWVDFGPPVGHEQGGRRPALIISPRRYNKQSSLILVCPITRNPEPWPFKVEISPAGRIQGFVLVDQVRSIDRHARFVRRVERLQSEMLDRVHAMMAVLLETPVR